MISAVRICYVNYLTYYVIHARAAHVVVRAARGYVVADVVKSKELEDGGAVEEFKGGTWVSDTEWHVR